ncbi:ankyrin repeat domain-containing protein [Novosphingobium sp.]|uniref:ankyrin repeat domain-containing protein n=1 Tax=Novosphingobium sp. TaxID=1874826 RepID=UPI00286E4F64|nr:ankyrin repeat domain-containing protein [Novosphingobium sp.]
MRNRVMGLALALAMVPAAGMMTSGTAQAQVSQGHKFLEAVRKKDIEAAKTMLGSSGAKSTPGNIIVNTRDITTGDSALHVVINRRDMGWLRYLVSNQADVNIRNNQGTTPLWLSVNTSFTEGALELIARGAKVNDPGPAGETPLISAVHQKNLELARALLAAGADANKADNSGRSAVDFALLSAKGTQLGNEVEAAGKAAKAKKTKTYGPSL